MNKKYRITSKFRFTMFVAIIMLVIITSVGTVLGFNTVNSASRDLYHQVQVQSGDTLWNIASAYSPENADIRKVVSDICDINDIRADQLIGGQKILVPVY